MTYDTLVVGAGFAGAIMAERLATQLGQRVLVVDRRDHVAGNAHDYVDEHGVLVHRYGPHIFRSSSQPIVDYLSAFTEWRPYSHRVLARVDDQLLPFPINRTTVNRLFGLELDSDEAMAAFLADEAEPVEEIRNSEDVVVARVGRRLFDRFFRGYTRKQWGCDAADLHASVCGSIPIRLDEDDRYHTAGFQQMPADGYTAMFERMLDQPGIDVAVSTEFADVRDEVAYDHLVFTGPIDGFFDHCHGPLPYRSLEFEMRTVATPGGGFVQPVAQINEPDESVPYTRTTEFRHMTGQDDHPWSTLAVEYPRAEGEPYYPVPRAENRERYHRYERLAAATEGVTFVGRLARYQYLNMNQVVGQALSCARRLIAARSRG